MDEELRHITEMRTAPRRTDVDRVQQRLGVLLAAAPQA